MRIPEAITVVALGVTHACTTVTPKPVETATVRPEPTGAPLTMQFTVRTCEDLNRDNWCGPQDFPLGHVPVQILYGTLERGIPTMKTLNAETLDIGEVLVEGPYMVSEDFFVGTPPRVTIDGATFCRTRTAQLIPDPAVADPEDKQVSVLFERCSPTPATPSPISPDSSS